MKESFRVYLVRHDDGRMTGHLMPRRSSFFSPPPPSAYGESEDDVLRQLEVLVRSRLDEHEDPLARYRRAT